MRGLAALELEYEINPKRLDSADVVGVLSDLDALSEAIQWRRAGERRRLLAGPNLVVLPSDARPLMTAPEIDVCIVPSQWVARLYEEDAPELRGRIAVWPAGVDAEYWKPDPLRVTHDRRALVYLKQLPGQRNAEDLLIRSAEGALERAGFAVTTVSYGSFAPDEYLELLRAVDLLVLFSPTESQGLALAEAWSVDVPTLVWAQAQLTYKGRLYQTSSAPFLSSRTGVVFNDSDALERLLEDWTELRTAFGPRAWVLEHMTDAKCARAYWDLATGPRRQLPGAAVSVSLPRDP
jgi:glycosyltransferase involved in cell wall biosynthesis